MSRMNWGRVLLGGLLAGVVLNVLDMVVFGMWLGRDFQAAMAAAGNHTPMNTMMPWFVVTDFLYGVSLVWLYAAIRPRYGAGVRTAIIAGFAMWLFIGLLHALGEAPMGLLPQRLYMLGTLAGLFELPIATVSGAAVYKEGVEAPVPAGVH